MTMKKSILTLLLGYFLLTSLNAQDSTSNYSDKVKSLDSILSNLYSVISGEKGEKRDWNLMRHLFHPDAKLIPSGKKRDGNYAARYITVEEYITNSGKWLIENGFFEKEIHRRVNTFGNISHVFSTYEAFHSEADEQPFMRGINSIQLLNDGDRWWIINIYWMQESKETPIPKKYLPKS